MAEHAAQSSSVAFMLFLGQPLAPCSLLKESFALNDMNPCTRPSSVCLCVSCLLTCDHTALICMSLELRPPCLLQDTTLEQQLITAGADRQQAMYSITAFQAASIGSSRHLLQDMAAMVAQAIVEKQGGLDPVQARSAVLTGSSRRRHLLQVGSVPLLAQGILHAFVCPCMTAH